MRFAITVTGPAYGTQQASSAWQFAQAVLQEGHDLVCVFFYREGVYNANQLTAPASDEFDLVRAWQRLHDDHAVALHICVAAACVAVSPMNKKLSSWGYRVIICSPDLR